MLVPTRELARQVAEVLRPLAEKTGLRADGLLRRSRHGRPDPVDLADGTDVVVATPGRLIDLRQRGDVDLDQIEVVVIDEADRMADMGFLPQVEWLLRQVDGWPPDHALLGHARRRR